MTDLAEQYRRQERWRRWDEALKPVPLRAGQSVLDLGCGVGAVTGRLHRMGARVIGVDGNEALLAVARQEHPGIRFEHFDLAALAPSTFGPVDGIWSSFVAAYLGDLDAALARWRSCLAPGGWIALVEIDDLFGHQPLPAPFADQIRAFYAEARAARRYDFECGRRLAGALERTGLRLLHESAIADDELAFSGPASDEVLAAWRQRLQRMPALQSLFGPRFSDFERHFLDGLAAPDHRSTARVVLAVATAPL
jgi:SAM-dependent methyltransferase